MKKLSLQLEELWPLAGAIEELRSNDVSIPAEADVILREALLNVNVSAYMKGTFPSQRDRLRKIIEALDVPDHLPSVYQPETRFTDRCQLAPFETTHIFEDHVLGVGLKSYPYVLDVNADGKKDLLVGDHDGFIYVFLNVNTDADPVFGRGSRLRAVDTNEPFVVQPNPKMSFGDLTGTGSLDMVLGNYAGQVAFAPNQATDGTLAFAIKDVSVLKTANGPIDVNNYAYPELVDWNGNGHLDLVVGNVAGQLWLFKNTGVRGEPIFEEGVEIPGIERVMYPCAFFVDWNGDGKKDMILGHRNGTVILYANVGGDSDPAFERVDTARHADGQPVDIGLLSHPVAVDWNNNGLVDLVVGNDPGQVQVFLNCGTPQQPVFSEPIELRDGGGELIMGVHPVFAMADFNHNGRRDLLVGHETKRLRLFANTGTAAEPTFDAYCEVDGIDMDRQIMAGSDAQAQAYWDLEGLEFNTEYLGNLAPCAVDWRNLGKLDLLVGHYTGLIYLFENVGTSDQPRYETGRALRIGDRLLRVAGFSTPIVCDWNNDGKKDLVTGDLLGRIHVFLNVGRDEQPEFAPAQMVCIDDEPVMLGPRSIVEVADLNGDGRKDLIVGNRLGGVYTLMNSGSDTEPCFETIERPQDISSLWRQLYDGLQHTSSGLLDFYKAFPKPGKAMPMTAVETSCPRVVDLDRDGHPHLLVSQRYGRVFVYDKLPHPA